jgi:choline monooxygenase
VRLVPRSVEELVNAYRYDLPLAQAWTAPSSWYVDPRISDLERRTVFSRTWQMVCRVDQVQRPGEYVTVLTSAGEPIVVVRGQDDVLRGFFNVCRHHAAAVATGPHGSVPHLRCPYHGWTYSLDGQLKGTPDFAGVCDFDRSEHGLLPAATGVWEQWVFVRVDAEGPSLDEFLGADLIARVAALDLGTLQWMERRHYVVDCNWKVFIDNYLDGGYHVPHLHKALGTVLDYSTYTIENGGRFCLQSSPIVTEGADERTSAVRTGDRARYFWLYPNFMINCYSGAMDTNLAVPLGPDRTDVIFDFYFSDVSEPARARNLASIGVSEQIQEEDVAICASVQRGLHSRAYSAGRLSVRREAGEHLFHRLLYDDFRTGLNPLES